MTRFLAPFLLHILFASTPIDALSMMRIPSPPNSQLNRRSVVGWIGSIVGTTAIIPYQPSMAADVDGLNVNDFLKTGQVAMPMGVAGQAGKSRPETGVTLRDGTDVSRDPRTGDVMAEIIVQDSKHQNAAAAVVLASYSSPWPLAKGTVFDVECRDASTGDGAFLAVTQSVGGKSNVSELSDSFILNNLVKNDGRLSFYGPPTDVKIKSSQILQQQQQQQQPSGSSDSNSNGASYKVMDLSYSIVSQATQTEIPRKARLAITIPSGSDQAVMLVASTSANRWNKGSNKLVASTIESFRAIPAPQTSMKIRRKPKKSDL